MTIVYLPLAHWVFDPGGWLAGRLHLLDFAGGTAVEVNSGAASLALAVVLGRRLGWPKEQARPHNLPAVMLGAGILWFGWFGFNAGSALAADGLAATAFLVAMLAGGTSMLGWLLAEQRRDGKPTTLGAASGAVAGLVGITPACGFVEPLGGAALVTIAYSGGLTYALARVLEKFVGLRAAPDDELAGIDEAEHAETGYDYGRIGAHITTTAAARAARAAPGSPAAAARSGPAR